MFAQRGGVLEHEGPMRLLSSNDASAVVGQL